jgi:hypothetical protein
MVRHGKIGIAPSGHIDNAADGLVEAIRDEAKISGLAALDGLRHDRATGTHGVSAQQRCRLTRRGHGLW